MSQFFRSFLYALNGLRWLVTSERNFKIQVCFAIFAILLGLFTKLKPLEWAWVFAAIGMVLGAEAMNTAVERLADAVHPKRHSKIGIVKDVAAGGVLIVALAALLIGLAVFVPHLAR